MFLIAQLWFNIPEFFSNLWYIISIGIQKLQSQTVPIVVGGLRPANVYVPPSYTSATAIPLLIVLHGFSSNGPTYEAAFNLKNLAD